MCDETDSKSKNSINSMFLMVWSCCSETLLCGIHYFTFSIYDSVSQFNYSPNKQWKGTQK